MVLATALITTVSSSALNLSTTAIGAEFSSSAAALDWLLTIYILMTVCFSVLFGKLADTFGKPKILLGGLAFYLIFSALAPMCHDLSCLLMMRAGQGIGAAMMFATNMALLVEAFPANRRGWALGYYVAFTYGGLALGPVAGGILTAAFGWRSVFWMMAIISGVSLALGISFCAKKSIPCVKSDRTLDWPGAVCFALAIGLIVFGFSLVGNSWAGWLVLAVGLVSLVIFEKLERRAPDPLLDLKMFRGNRNFTLSIVAALLNYAATFAITYLISIYLQVVKGFSTQSAGLLLIIQPAVQMIISPLSGRLSDKKSPFALASIGMGICAAALSIFALAGAKSPLGLIIVGLIVVGIGFGIFSSPNQNIIMSSVNKRDHGVASSLTATARNIGQAMSMALITITLSAKLGGATFAASTPAELTGATRLAFAIFALICLVGTVISLRRKSQSN
jgi:MFS family permease